MGKALIKDPVCGMRMTAAEVIDSCEYAGVVYRFCSHACRAKFEREPDKFADRPGKP